MTVPPEGVGLPEAVAPDPEGRLGPAQVARWGATTGFLVKLLDAGQRLPVHCHPTRAFARAHLGCSFGKTEVWLERLPPRAGQTVLVPYGAGPASLRGRDIEVLRCLPPEHDAIEEAAP
ncbi:hypothetical protein J4709_48745 [Actinomadura sp. LCR2-06]|uniref:Cupin domain-containing protein n=1 Tax=Actinomadura violacea TaxID=2819934 RepID=A0ABS3S8Z8_9ACTN|nr:hypothetical protein [Actinomadura violacea]